MSHTITINGVDADIELDYSDIWENIEDSASDQARDVVRDLAWDEVAGSVEEMVDNHSPSVDVSESVEELLDEYNRIKAGGGTPCSIGRAFERAVASVDACSAQEGTESEDSFAIRAATDARIANLERLVSNLLGQIQLLGERAAEYGRGVSS